MTTLFHANPMKNPLFPFIPFIILYLATISQGYNSNSVQSHFSKFTRTLPTSPSSSSSVCNDNTIPHKTACESLLLSLKTTNPSAISVPKDLFDHSVHFSFNHATNFVTLSNTIEKASHKSMADCLDLQEDSLDQLSNVMNRKKKYSYTKSDVQTWLSAALTNQETCIESLQNGAFNSEKGEMVSMARNLSQHLSNSLSLYVSHYMKKGQNGNSKPKVNGGRKLLSENGYPGWVSVSDRKLLETPVTEIKAHAVVAKDGSGTHMSVSEALRTVAAAELDGGGGGGRDVIYVKAGTYHEYINIPTKRKNVMLMGDGKDKTVIIGNRNAEDGWSTYQSATVAAMGDGFIAKGITFVNNAGPNKHQAVALRVGADKSVIYQCSIQGYQDSLYTHSKRQFYRDSDISGTIDFIFGNSAAVIQNCNIVARASGPNYITAQGRTDPNQNTGISIQNCKISGGNSRSTYLGRPWHKYSRVAIMKSFLDGSINPAGWYPWSGSFALNTLYYAEYLNSGPGSSTSGRVKWPGYHNSLTAASAQTFTVANFIAGNTWLPATGVGFDSGLGN
ncbi:Plant invertase/pectin methylesterase inhibitor superfamily [Euphorbia peplus]|nr:Plant invertase/pectin methylesterase inhibitor superfamily [Euphorbia peplus]